jgi:hypothetical protein
MRWTRQRRRAGKSQGKLCERSTGTQTNGAEAYGKTVWSWHPLLMPSRRRFCEPDRVLQDRQFADDGDKNEFVAGESTA